MQEFIKDYMKTYSICMQNKPKRHKPYGLLKQLPIPPQPWKSISIDFIEQLPESQGFTNILVVVDRLTKQAIFTPIQRSIDATGLVKNFVKNIFSKHGVSIHVISDWGSEFVSKFFKALALTLNMKLHFTSGYHPEANSQTEWTNQTLEQYLRIYCNYQQSLMPKPATRGSPATNTQQHPKSTRGIKYTFWQSTLELPALRRNLQRNTSAYSKSPIGQYHTPTKSIYQTIWGWSTPCSTSPNWNQHHPARSPTIPTHPHPRLNWTAPSNSKSQKCSTPSLISGGGTHCCTMYVGLVTKI